MPRTTLAALLICLWAAGGCAAVGTRPSTVLFMAVLAGAPYAWLWGRPSPGLPVPRAGAWLGGLLAYALFLFAEPQFSDDIHRYLWDGRVTLHGLNPWSLAPDSPALAHLRDAHWHRVNHRELTTIYPPLAQALFAAGAWFHQVLPLAVPSGFWLRALLVFLHGGALWLFRRSPHAPDPDNDRFSLALWLNPLVIVELASNGHPDILVGHAVVASVMAVGAARPWLAALWAMLGVGLKFVGGLAVLTLRAHRMQAAVVVLAGAVAFAVVTRSSTRDTTTGMQSYTQRWEGNGSIYPLLKTGFYHALRTRLGSHVDLGAIGLCSPGPLDSVVAPRRSQLNGDPLPTCQVPLHVFNSVLSKVLCALFFLAVMAWTLRRTLQATTAARVTLWALLLLSPQVHPWYVLWLLPVDCKAGGRAALLWTLVAWVAHFPVERWLTERVWFASSEAHLFQYLVVAMGLWLDHGDTILRESRDPKPHHPG